MACAAQNLTLTIGSSKTYRLTVYDEDGALLDLTGSTLYFTAKTTAGATIFAKVSTDTNQIEILTQSGDTLGQADVKIVPSDTSAATAGNHRYDAWIELASGKRYQIVPVSTFTLTAPVTVIP